MSRTRASGGLDLATIGLVAAGVALLPMRLWLPALGTTGRVVGSAALLLAILTASLLVPVQADRARLGRAIPLAVGFVAVLAALAAGGRPPPAPFAAWALPLALLAAVAEEALFRRAAYGILQRHGAAVAIGVSAAAFALVHVPMYGIAALPVDLGAGLLLSWQRWASGTWTVPAMTHAGANVVMTVVR